MNRFINKNKIKDWFRGFKIDERNPQIYLLQEREMIWRNENTYKVGRTDVPLTRFWQYPKYSLLLKMNAVSDSIEVERIVKECFKKEFIQMDYGVEYFYGNRYEMLKMIDKITSQHKLSGFVSPWRIPVMGTTKALPDPKIFRKRWFNFSKPLPVLPAEPTLIEEPSTPTKINSFITKKKHMSHEKTVQQSFTCHRCNKQLSSRRRLNEHLAKFVPCDYVCKHCNNKSETYEAYRYHMRSKHASLKKKPKKILFKCPICLAPFESQKTLRQHFIKDIPCRVREDKI